MPDEPSNPLPAEVTLRPPYRFDQSIGYWTGEPDREALARALAEVTHLPDVEREVTEEGVTLRGPREAVAAEAAALRAAGLV